MVTDRTGKTSMDDVWDLQWVQQSPLFAPLRPVCRHLSGSVWPDVAALNEVVRAYGSNPANCDGQPIRFVAQRGRPRRFEDTFEPRTYLRGEVMVRERNWHDLFNALVWMTFPESKASINRRHYASLHAQAGRQRGAEGDALTLFDEDGMVVLSSEAALLDLLRRFQWKQLFWERRDAVCAQMRFVIFGHAMYEKALHPFVGMTAKAVLLQVPGAMLQLEGRALNEATDRLLADYVGDRGKLITGQSLAPLPALGIPGWWPRNQSAGFYDDVSYFRPGRGGRGSSDSSSIS